MNTNSYGSLYGFPSYKFLNLEKMQFMVNGDTDTQRNRDVIVYRFPGVDVDEVMATKEQDELKELVNNATYGLIIGLDNVSHLSSEGLGVIIATGKYATEHGKILAISGVRTPTISSLFSTTRVDKLFKIYDSIEEAEAAIRDR
jgi:anti-sigma B factor antagonist